MSEALTFFLILVGLPVLGLVAIAIAVILKGSSAIKARQLDAEETRLLQEIHQGLAKMERRIDALETIVIENEKPANQETTQL